MRPSDEHYRLVHELREWLTRKAEHMGLKVSELECLPSGRKPDVLLGEKRYNLIFLGECKNLTFESPERTATRKRLQEYMEELHSLFESGKARGGIFAVAVNDRTKTQTWVDFLDGLAKEAELGTGFRVERTGRKTWVLWWQPARR
jgi:hypothetical protein